MFEQETDVPEFPFTRADRELLQEGVCPISLKDKMMARLALVQILADTTEERPEAITEIIKFIHELDVLIEQKLVGLLTTDAAVEVYVNRIETLTIDLNLSFASLPGTQINRVAKVGSNESFWAVGVGGVDHPKRFFIDDTMFGALQQAYDTLTHELEESKQ